MKIKSMILTVMTSPAVSRINVPLVVFFRFILKFLAPHSRWENDCCEIMRKFGFEKTFNSKTSVDADGNPIPWYSYPAIEFLRTVDFSDCSVFEYGSGNSTLYWEKHAEKVTAVEHDAKWYEFFSHNFSERINAELRENKIDYVSALSGMYDVIVIDGPWRDLCAERAVKHINGDGIIILDDSQRGQASDEYKRALKTLQQDERFLQLDFYGFTPITPYTKVTTLFISRVRRMLHNVEIPVYGIGNIQNEN